MSKISNDTQLKNLELKLIELKKQEKELDGINRKSYETLKVISLITLLVCIVFQTCYIKDSLDLGSGSLAYEEETNFNHSEDGPYNLDDNTKKTDNKKNNSTNGTYEKNNINNENNNINFISNNIANLTNNTVASTNNISNEITNNDDNNDIFPTESVTETELKEIKIIQVSSTSSSEPNIRTDFKELSTLDIFNTVKYIGEKLIYPGIEGSYDFNIENYTSKNISYRLSFSIENPKNVNILFKLKRNGKYITGDQKNYVSYYKLNQDNLNLKSKMGDTFILEWKWIEAQNDNDTTSKTERGNYKINIKGEAY